ncbi:MAG: AAA family ATPase [Gallionella sp.]|nr:AAA family ATPase [Gallionella sp.]
MYKDYFRLNEMPFSIAPDPRFLFMSDRHREAMAHLLYGVQGEGGIVLLTGEVGTGKTTICRSLLEQLPEHIDVAFILNPRMSVEELLQTICEEFHIKITATQRGIKTFVDALNAQLLAAHAEGHRAILIVDEAQNLDATVLEQLRLLTNLETNTRKLLQIFLIGQPELQGMLAKPEMRQVAQRVVARYHLGNLNQSEANTYVAHRLRIAGASPLIFPEALVKQVYRASNGVPRLINLICDRALLGAYVQGQQQVTSPIIRQAILEVFAATPRKPQRAWFVSAGLVAVATGIAILFVTQMNDTQSNKIVPIATKVAAASAVAPAQAASAPLVVTSPLPVKPATTPLKWPSDVPLINSDALAFQSLFKLYDVDFNAPSIPIPCQQAVAKGLRCYEGRGGLSDLFLIDQPVVLRLTSSDGKAYSATLTALDHQAATLVVGGIVQHVSLSDLANAWLGQFVVIWNAPPNFKSELKQGQRNDTVAWMRHAMEAVDGIHDNGSDVFDAALEKRVRAFQLIEGMQPDGLVGSRTLIRLNVRNSNLPHLVTDKKG